MAFVPIVPAPAPEQVMELMQPGPGDPLVGFFGKERLELLVQSLLTYVVNLEQRVADLEQATQEPEPEVDDTPDDTPVEEDPSDGS